MRCGASVQKQCLPSHSLLRCGTTLLYSAQNSELPFFPFFLTTVAPPPPGPLELPPSALAALRLWPSFFFRNSEAKLDT